MYLCGGQSRSCVVSLIIVSMAMLLLLGSDQAEAVPLSRYGRANLSRYGKRSSSQTADRPLGGAQYSIDDDGVKGACRYTGMGDLYWCTFISTGDMDG